MTEPTVDAQAEREAEEKERARLRQVEATMDGKRWWEMTAEEIVCGRCDRDPAGRGARAVNDPDRGFIVACGTCLPEIARRRERLLSRHRGSLRA